MRIRSTMLSRVFARTRTSDTSGTDVYDDEAQWTTPRRSFRDA